MERILKRAGLIALGVVVAIQLVPYGRTHSNPPVRQEAPWPTAEARQIAVTACYDCHSNTTKWPAYSYVAPISWWVANHVDEGRDKLNFTDWTRRQELDELAEAVNEGSMPPNYYKLIHGGAKLSATEKQTLVDALRRLARAAPGGGTAQQGGETGAVAQQQDED